jgi:hypothetical protein
MGIKRRKIQVITSRLKAFNTFFDAFTSALNSAWKVLVGSWSSSGGAAYSTTPASSYPLATVPMAKSDVTAQIETAGQGTGIAIWVTDSGNWWGVVSGQDGATNCNCQTCYACNAYAGGNCASYNASYCINTTNYYACSWSNACTGNCSSCCKWNYSGNVCNGYCGYCCSWSGAVTAYCPYTSCSGVYNASYCASYNAVYCASASYYSCNCQTCYPPFIRVIQSASSIVSEIYKWTISAIANSLKVITSGTGITAKAYSDNSLSTQIDSDLTYTATGATITTKFGIVVAPSSYSQGNSLDNFNITTN